MKRIGIDLREVKEYQTGIGNYMKSLSSRLINLDKENIYYLIFNKGLVFEEFKSKYDGNRRVKVVSIYPQSQSLLSEFLLFRDLKKLQLDVFWTDIFGITYFPGVPYVLSLHDIIGVKNPKFVSFIYRIFNIFHLKWSLSHSLYVFVPTISVKNDVVKYLGIEKSKKYIVTGEGITLPKVDSFADIRSRYNVKGDYAIFIGTDKLNKNILGLIKSIKKFRKKYKRFIDLVLVGISADSKYLNSNNLKFIKALGHISEEDKFNLLRKASFFITLSFDEGFCLPVLEASSMKVPIICSDIPVLREVLGDDGAIFVDPQNTSLVAKKINLLYSGYDNIDMMINSALEKTRMYNWKKSAKKILKYLG